MVVKARPRPNKKRFQYPIPVTLFDRINMRAEKHLPKPQKNDFVKYLLELAIEEYKAETVLRKAYSFRGETIELQHFIDENMVDRFNKLFDQHEPKSYKQHFVTFLLSLGIQKYEDIYNEYGFLDED